MTVLGTHRKRTHPIFGNDYPEIWENRNSNFINQHLGHGRLLSEFGRGSQSLSSAGFARISLEPARTDTDRSIDLIRMRVIFIPLPSVDMEVIVYCGPRIYTASSKV